MSLKVKSIIAGAVVILTLIILLVILLQKPPNEALDFSNDISHINTTLDFENPLSLIAKEANMIESVTVRNKSDEYVIEKLSENEWGIKELNNFNLITNYSTMLRTVSNLMAVEIVETDAEDLEQFGFNAPNITIDVVFNDMKTYQIKVGDISTQIDTAYVIIDDNPTVYRFFTNTFSEFLLSRKAFISTNIIPTLPKYNNETIDPNFTYMKLEREDLTQHWEFEKYQSKTDILLTIPVYLQFSSPVECDLDAERFPKYFENYFGLSALSIQTFNPTEEQLNEYGLDNPHAKFTTVYSGGDMEFTLIVGNNISTQGFNSRYLMLDGTDIVYIVENNKLPFLTVKTSDFISSILVLETINGFSEIDVTINNKTTNFEIWEENNIKVQNQDDSYSYAEPVLMVNMNGENINLDLFKQYLQTLLVTNVTDVTDKKTTGTPNISIKYTYLDESIETVDVYEQGDRTTIIVLNKKDYFIGRTGFVDNLKEQTEILLSKANS